MPVHLQHLFSLISLYHHRNQIIVELTLNSAAQHGKILYIDY